MHQLGYESDSGNGKHGMPVRLGLLRRVPPLPRVPLGLLVAGVLPLLPLRLALLAYQELETRGI
jgi:hypothetical protein